MDLYLVRHAQAVDEGPSMPDEARYLTTKGRGRAAAVGRALAARGVVLDALVTSPLVRAVQTAELAAGPLAFTGEVTTLWALSPGGSVRRAATELGALGASVMAVGHEPGMTALGVAMTGGPFPSFAKGQVCCVRGGRLLWTLDPRTLTFSDG